MRGRTLQRRAPSHGNGMEKPDCSRSDHGSIPCTVDGARYRHSCRYSPNSLSLLSLNHPPRLHTFLIKVHGIPIGLHTHEKPVPLLFLLSAIGSRRASLGIRSRLDLSWIWVCFHSSFWLLLLGCWLGICVIYFGSVWSVRDRLSRWRL